MVRRCVRGRRSVAVASNTSLFVAFDFINLQIYETKSHASYNTSVLGTPQVNYLASYITMLSEPMQVDFTADPDFSHLGVATFDLRGKVNVGLISSGGKGGPITAQNATKAYKSCSGGDLRGWFYWCIGDDADGNVPRVLSSAFS